MCVRRGVGGARNRSSALCLARVFDVAREILFPMSTGENSQSHGWLIEVLVRRVPSKEPEQRFFAAAIADEEAATAAVRKSLGGLHCVVEAKCRLSLRALQQILAPNGKVVPMRPERTRRPG